jgi:phosphomannomutase
MPVNRGQELVTRMSQNAPDNFASFPVTQVETMDGAKLILDDESWLLFRQSGTEPVLRLYSEATSIEKMNKLLDAAQELVK